MEYNTVAIEKNNIKIIEYSEVEDKLFIQCGCVGFYVTRTELKDLNTLINYYMTIEEYSSIKISTGGEYVAT